MAAITENDLFELGFNKRTNDEGRVTYNKGVFIFYFNKDGLPRLESWCMKQRVTREEGLGSKDELIATLEKPF